MLRTKLLNYGCCRQAICRWRAVIMLSVFTSLGFTASMAVAVPGSCCEQGGTCSIVEPAVCSGTFIGGTDCGPIGACCDASGSCSLQFESCCQGMWHPEDCVPPEACCLPDAVGGVFCQEIDPKCCKDLGGNPQGPGSVCDANGDGIDDACIPPVFCPIPNTQVCADQQATNCINNDPLTPEGCLPLAVTLQVFNGQLVPVAEPNACACAIPGETCGPVLTTELPGGIMSFRCAGPCPDPTQPCFIHLSGVSVGASSIEFSGPVKEIITCECASNPGACCDALTGNCTQTLQTDCLGTWFGGPCLPVEPCCFGDRCVDLDPRCCVANGGAVQPTGTACDPNGAQEACCLSDAAGIVSCVDMDALCCDSQGGNPQGVGTTCANINGCNNPPLFCPIPPTNTLCKSLQFTECLTTDPTTLDDCLATSISIVQNAAGLALQANMCACSPGVCGPVTAVPVPGTPFFDVSCENNCPAGAGKCVIHIGGVSTGAVTQSYSGPIDDLTCECASDPGTCCEVGTGICLSSLQADCQGTWFGGPCLPVEPCCFGDNCVDLDPRCCVAEGGTVQPTGTACDPNGAQEACCLSDAAGIVSCVDMDALCCDSQGGNPQGVGTTCANINGCNNPPLFCPIPPTNTLCKSLQFTECLTTDPATQDNCLATSVSIVQNAVGLELQANMCACDPGVCGPVTAIPVLGTPFFDVSCENNCPAGAGKCLIHVAGVSTGVSTQSFSGPIDDLTCECASDPGACCEPVTGICSQTLQTACQGTWFGGPCLTPEPCCFGDFCETIDPRCCVATGGTVQPAGTTCSSASEACCIGAGVTVCLDMFPLCCIEQGGNPQGINTTCVNINGCNNPPLVCPMPANDKLCVDLQATDCQTNDPLTTDECRPTSVSIVSNGMGGTVTIANTCACVPENPTCGPVTVINVAGSTATQVSCEEACMDPTQPCFVHLDGVSQGSIIVNFQAPVTGELTCECASNPGACCDPITGICSQTLQTDCNGAWFGGPCQTPEPCCFGDRCVDLDPRCCKANGGSVQPAGSACDPNGAFEACCLSDAAGIVSCLDMDALCCADQGGNPQGVGTTCANINGCNNPPLFCPIPPTNKLCKSLQFTDCMTNDPTTLDNCLATSISIVQNAAGLTLQANMCACDPGVCGPVTAIPVPGTPFFDVSCENNCPAGAGKCVIHIGGVSTGAVTQSYSGPIDDLTCECASNPGTCCEAGTGICLTTLQADCQGTWFGGPCLPVEPCCFGDRCVDIDPRCCVAEGGTVQPVGSACDPNGAFEACCIDDAAGVVSCLDMDALCCADMGGNPQGGGTTCVNINGCTNPPLVCPMPATDKLCKNLQALECQTTDPTTPNFCQATSVSIVQDATGLIPQANTCACVDDTCGPVTTTTIPGTSFVDVSCKNLCPSLNEPCLIHVNGVSTGASELSFTGPVDGLTCECASNPGTCCDGMGCSVTLQADCLGTWFGGPCLPLVACCLGDSCVDMDPRCCENAGGVAQAAGEVCAPAGQAEACCIPNAVGGTDCRDLDPLCCLEQGGMPLGAGSVCLGDANNDGTDDACGPQVCEPAPDGQTCEQVACVGQAGAFDVCSPQCAVWTPLTQSYQITDCDCKATGECQVDLSPVGGRLEPECVVVDDGTGTATLPPPGCPYLSPDEFHMIVDGLPPNTEILADTIHAEFVSRVSEQGGNLGGRREEFDSTLVMNMVGTGDLAGFARMIVIPVLSEVHTGPRTLGDPIQTFPTDMFKLEGSIFGDPDFDVLTIRAGNAFGLPSPGGTTLTLRGDGQWTVDSFFDVYYEIEFQGAAGSALTGFSGTTRGIVQMQAGSSPKCVGGCPPGKICLGSKGLNLNGTISVCCKCVSLVPPHPVGVPFAQKKDRYISFNPATNEGNPVAHRVTRVGSATPWYVSCALQDAGSDGKLGVLVPNPEFCVWIDPVIHVRGCEIVPGNTYSIESTPDNATFSSSLLVDTTPVPLPREYGDLGGGLVAGIWAPPDGLVTAQDILMAVKAFQLDPKAPHISRVDTDGKIPNGIMAGSDILREVLAFGGVPFGFGVTGCQTGTCVPSCP